MSDANPPIFGRLVLAVTVFLYTAVVLYQGWNWFVVTLGGGLRPLTYVHALGLLTLIKIVTLDRNYRAVSETDDDKITSYRLLIVAAAIAHGVMFATHSLLM